MLDSIFVYVYYYMYMYMYVYIYYNMLVLVAIDSCHRLEGALFLDDVYVYTMCMEHHYNILM